MGSRAADGPPEARLEGSVVIVAGAASQGPTMGNEKATPPRIWASPWDATWAAVCPASDQVRRMAGLIPPVGGGVAIAVPDGLAEPFCGDSERRALLLADVLVV